MRFHMSMLSRYMDISMKDIIVVYQIYWYLEIPRNDWKRIMIAKLKLKYMILKQNVQITNFIYSYCDEFYVSIGGLVYSSISLLLKSINEGRNYHCA